MFPIKLGIWRAFDLANYESRKAGGGGGGDRITFWLYY